MQPVARRVLVVDDDDIIRGSLTDALVDEGYELRGAAHGQEALAVLTDWRPDVILLDLMMPVMDGWTFRAEQQKHPEHAEIPVIILSATRDLSQHAERLDAAAAFLKPFDLDELLTTIETIGNPNV